MSFDLDSVESAIFRLNSAPGCAPSCDNIVAVLRAAEVEVVSLRGQLEEALGIIKDLAKLHDSYIGYLSTHYNYNEEAARAISERINVLKLKQ